METDLAAVLARLEGWLAAHAPAIHAQLTPGATDTELDALEVHIGLRLPEAYRVLYRTHGDWGGTFGLDQVPLGEVVGEWDVRHDLSTHFQETRGHSSHPPGFVRAQHVNLGWIPLFKDWDGSFVGVDLDPGPGGGVGQIITFGDHEQAKYVLAPDLGAFLAEYLRRLETGRVLLLLHEEDDPASVGLSLLDADGAGLDNYFQLADLYPGFGAAPARRSR